MGTVPEGFAAAITMIIIQETKEIDGINMDNLCVLLNPIDGQFTGKLKELSRAGLIPFLRLST
jgi:hypothetical protein